MAQSSPRKRKRKSSGKGAAGPSLSPGQLTQRLRSIPQEARDGIPQGDDSAGALIFGLLMVLVAVGFVGWHYLRRFLGPTVPPARIEPASPEISQLTHLPLVQSVPLTVYAFDDSGIYLVPLQVEAASPDQELAILRKALEAASTPDGLGRLLPGDTRLRDLRREGPLAIVDLPQEALAQAGGATGQQVLLEGLTRAVTSVPGITQVQFVVDGRSVAYTDAGVALDAPWSPEDLGELNTMADGGNAKGTFYFLDATRTYLVPIQLPYPAQEITLQTKLERLVEGPPPGKGLQPIWPEQLILRNLNYDAERRSLLLDLESSDPVQHWSLFKPNLLIKAVVLTLRDVQPISSLAIQINGEDAWSSGPFAEVQRSAVNIDLFNPVGTGVPAMAPG